MRNFLKLHIIFALTLFAPGSVYAESFCARFFDRLTTRASLSLPEGHLAYSTGRKEGRVRVMTSEQFRKDAEMLDPDTIVVLDELPTDMDPPYLAAIITGRKLPTLGSHAQEMYQAISAPLVHVPDAPNYFRKFEGKRLIIETEPDASNFNGPGLVAIREKSALASSAKSAKKQSLLPVSAPRYPMEVVPVENRELFPDYLTGQKFGPLAETRAILPKKNTPDIVGVTTGYWDFIKKDYTLPGKKRILLGKLIDQNIKKALKSNNENEVRRLLEEIRTAIQGIDFRYSRYRMNKLFENLSKHFGTEGNFSFRSSNDVEDFLGAGVYSSSFGTMRSVDELEQHLRDVWSSLYSYRAFKLRKHFGLREENTSMALLVHPRKDGEVMNGVATFAPESTDTVFELNAIRSSTDRATSPTAHAQGLSMRAMHPNEVQFTSTQYSPAEREALERLYGLMKKVQQHFKDKSGKEYFPLKIEWILERDAADPTKLNPVILQVKEAINVADREAILYGAKEAKLAVDTKLVRHPMIEELERGKKLPVYHLADVVRAQVKKSGGKGRISVPMRAFVTKNNELITLGWKPMPRPHTATSFTYGVAQRYEAGSAYYGYLGMELVTTQNGKTVADHIILGGTGGSGGSDLHGKSAKQALRYFIETFKQLPQEFITSTTRYSVSGVGSDIKELRNLPALTMKELEAILAKLPE